MRNSLKLHPDLQVIIAFGLYKCYRKGLKVRITETYRTVSEQDLFYKQGSSQCKGTNYGSMHQWGVAFDVCRLDGNGAFDFNGWIEQVAKIFKSYGLAWGGNWISFVDKPHFQMSKYQDAIGSVSALKLKYGTPSVFIDTWKDAEIDIKQMANLTIGETEILLNKYFTEIKSKDDKSKVSVYYGNKTLKRKTRLGHGVPVFLIEDKCNGRSKVAYIKGKKIYTGVVYNFELERDLSPFKSITLTEDKAIYRNKYNSITKREKAGKITDVILSKGKNVKYITEDEKYIKIRYKLDGVWSVGWIKK